MVDKDGAKSSEMKQTDRFETSKDIQLRLDARRPDDSTSQAGQQVDALRHSKMNYHRALG